MAIRAKGKTKKLGKQVKEIKKAYTQHTVLPPEQQRLLEQYVSLVRQLDELQARVEELQEQASGLADSVADILEQLTDNIVQVNDILLKLSKRRYQSKRPRYKDALMLVMPHLSEELKKAIEPLLEAEYTLAYYVKHQPVESLADRVRKVFARVKQRLKGLLQKVKARVQRIAMLRRQLQNLLKQESYQGERLGEKLLALFEARSDWLNEVIAALGTDCQMMMQEDDAALLWLPEYQLSALIKRDGKRFVAYIADGVVEEAKELIERGEAIDFEKPEQLAEILYDYV